jgi:aspartyl-tRNA(Asn)/glutamyl-tRNA(Gln) amidotransferase subunit A
VADAALMLNVIAGPDERDRHSLPATGEDFSAAATETMRARRIAWSPDLGYARVDPEVRQLTEAAARRFASDLGCEVEEAAPGFSDPSEAIGRIFYGGIGSWLAEHWTEWRDKLDPGLVEALEPARSWSGFDVAQAYRERSVLWDSLCRFFARYDALLTPTMPITAFPLGLDRPVEVAGRPVRGLEWTPFTYPFNLNGVPAISVPCGWTSENLPVGLQIVGPRFADAELLRMAAAYEAVAPWRDRLPPVDAAAVTY